MDISVNHPYTVKEVIAVRSAFITLIVSVVANVISYYICKWLDRWFTDKK